MKSIFPIALLIILASCAPAFMPAERFPIHIGEVWRMQGQVPNSRSIDRLVVIKDNPKIEDGFLTAALQGNRKFGMAVYKEQLDVALLEVDIFESSTRASGCVLRIMGNAAVYEGWAFYGTIEEIQTQLKTIDKYKPTCTLTKQ